MSKIRAADNRKWNDLYIEKRLEKMDDYSRFFA